MQDAILQRTAPEMDSANHFLVGRSSDGTITGTLLGYGESPCKMLEFPFRLSREQAINLAAWIVSVANITPEEWQEWEEILDEISET